MVLLGVFHWYILKTRVISSSSSSVNILLLGTFVVFVKNLVFPLFLVCKDPFFLERVGTSTDR